MDNDNGPGTGRRTPDGRTGPDYGGWDADPGGLWQGAIDEYSELIESGTEMDPAIVYDAGDGHLYPADGQHRLRAYRKAGRHEMPCLIVKGSRCKRILRGLEENRKHTAERLSREEQHHAVEVLLREKPGLSDGAIGRLVGLTDRGVAKIRKGATPNSSESPTRTGVDGRVYSMTNLTRPSPAASAPAAPELPTVVPYFFPARGLRHHPLSHRRQPVATAAAATC